jgi:predicted O-linked N-acetylglucosamine transferase (SPINDLY family)
LTKGYFTFGSQNQLVKVTPKVIDVWSRILRDVPDSRLVLAGRALNDSSTRTSFIEAFLREGIETHRLDLRPGTSQQGILSNYQDIDLALDPFPCAGGTTTCEALYMGVPVISLFGDRFAGRHSAAHLMACGLDEFVTYDTDSYHALSVKIGCSPQMLSSLRADLRPKMQASQLCDGAGFARNFSEVLQYMWMQHAHPKPPALGSQSA